MEQLHVVIVGAGMGGLTAALALQQAGHSVEVHDRAPALLPVGAGVSLWSNGVKVLCRLGLGRSLRAVGGMMRQMCYRSKTGELLTRFSLEPLVAAVGQRPYPVARSDLQRLLLEAVGADKVRLGATCVAIEQDASSATAVFEGGHRARGDVVVAADGTHSLLRAAVLGHPVARRPLGYVNFNGLVPARSELAPLDTWVTFVGDGQRASLMPVGGGRFYFFFDVPSEPGRPAPADGVAAELSRCFAGWAEPVQRLLGAMEVERVTRADMYDVEPLPKIVSGRIALLGDAAHSMAPDLGQGGCQAMEDAWVLANVLSSHDQGVQDALLRYQAERLDRVREIIARARRRSDVTHGAEPSQTRAWYGELAREDGTSILSALCRTIQGGPLH